MNELARAGLARERTVVLAGGDLRGNLVTDAHLATLAIEHGTSVCSFDSDFARFGDLHWINPASR